MSTPTAGRSVLLLLAALAVAGGAGVLVLTFGRDRSADPAGAETRAANPLLVQDGGQEQGSDPLGVFASVETKAEPAPKPRLPELGFQEVSEGLPHSGTWIGYPLLADFTGDGRADLVASNREEDGFNAWMAPAQRGQAWTRCIEGLPRDLGYGPAQAADFNSDGIPDLLLSAHSDAIRLYLNDGKMQWKRSEKPIANTDLVLDVDIGNLNGDPFPDVVGIGHFKGGLAIHLGDGQGGLQRVAGTGPLDERFFGRDVELADIDGDGLDDIVVTTNDVQKHGLKVLLTQPGETLSWRELSEGLPVPPIGNSLMAVSVGRFTEDPRPQLACCRVPDTQTDTGKRDAIGVYGWSEAEQTWKHVDSGLQRGETYRDVRAADLNGDGFLDLMAMSLEQGAAIYLGDGKGSFQAKGRLPGVHGKGRIAFGDIDGDKLVDVVIAVPAQKEHPEGGGVRAFLNRPAIWH